MKRTTAIIIILVAGVMAESALAVHAGRIAEYWRNRYDEQKLVPCAAPQQIPIRLE